ncbi:MAG: hypothetical protein ACO3LE_03085 [Bdellovibrionota bacterium]
MFRFFFVGSLFLLALQMACQKEEPLQFQLKNQIYSPLMVSPVLKAFTSCRLYDSIKDFHAELRKARAQTDGFKILRDTQNMLVLGWTENSAKYFFSDLEACESYLEGLKASGWVQK